MAKPERQTIGMAAALLTPVFMGMTPIFGKLAIRSGFDAFTLAAVRTCMAALLLWGFYLIFFRKYTYIFPAGIMGTFVVGFVNGIGSLMYYNGLRYLDNASLSQLLYMTYAIFVMLLSRAYGQRISKLSVTRAIMALVAVYLLTTGTSAGGSVHWLGVGLMLGAAFMYAYHVVLSQRVMFEMPAPTMALYALSFMGLTVLVARLIVGAATPMAWVPAAPDGWLFVAALTTVTALSRVTLFAGVRNLGSLQTTLLNVAEGGVTLLVGVIWLDESLAQLQWVGVALLGISALLSHWDRDEQVAAPRPAPQAGHLRSLMNDTAGHLPPGVYGLFGQLFRGLRRTRKTPDFSDIMQQFPNLPDLSQYPELLNADLPEVPPKDLSQD